MNALYVIPKDPDDQNSKNQVHEVFGGLLNLEGHKSDDIIKVLKEKKLITEYTIAVFSDNTSSMQVTTREWFKDDEDLEDDLIEGLTVVDLDDEDDDDDDDGEETEDEDEDEEEEEQEEVEVEDVDAEYSGDGVIGVLKNFTSGSLARIRLLHIGCIIHILALICKELKTANCCKKVTKIGAKIRRNGSIRKLLLNHPKLKGFLIAKWFTDRTKIMAAENKTRWYAFKRNLDRLLQILEFISIVELSVIFKQIGLTNAEYTELKTLKKVFDAISKAQLIFQKPGYMMIDTIKEVWSVGILIYEVRLKCLREVGQNPTFEKKLPGFSRL